MKKAIIFLLAAMMALSFAACSSKEEKEKETLRAELEAAREEREKEAAQEEKKAQEAPAKPQEEETPAETPEETAEESAEERGSTPLGRLEHYLRFSDSWGTERGYIFSRLLWTFGEGNVFRKLCGWGWGLRRRA